MNAAVCLVFKDLGWVLGHRSMHLTIVFLSFAEARVSESGLTSHSKSQEPIRQLPGREPP